MQLTQYSQFIVSSEVAFLQWGKIVILLNRYTTAMQSNCSCYLKKTKQKKKDKNKKKPQPKDWNKNRKYRSQTRKKNAHTQTKNSFPRKTMTLENMELLHDFVKKCVRKKITRITDHGPIFILRMQMKSGKMAIRINRKYFIFPCSFCFCH